MKAVTCPVCQGKGTICNHDVDIPLYLHPTCPTCHGCGGVGWVQVHEEAQYSYPTTLPELYHGCVVTLTG